MKSWSELRYAYSYQPSKEKYKMEVYRNSVNHGSTYINVLVTKIDFVLENISSLNTLDKKFHLY